MIPDVPTDITGCNAKVFVHCPRCGIQGLSRQDRKSYICRTCGFIFYINVATAVGVFIRDDAGRLLVTVRKHAPAANTWGLPGGFVDPGETAEIALRRELMEELNMELDSVEYLFSLPNHYPYADVEYATCDLFFRGHACDCSAASAGDEITDFLWVPRAELDTERFGLPSVKIAFRLYLDRYAGQGPSNPLRISKLHKPCHPANCP